MKGIEKLPEDNAYLLVPIMLPLPVDLKDFDDIDYFAAKEAVCALC